MEHLLLIIIVGLIALVRWLFVEGGLKKLLGKLDADLQGPLSTRNTGSPPPVQRTSPGVPRTPPRLETEEERKIRKFMEALGLPTDPGPSTAPAPQSVPQPVPQQTRRPAIPPVPPIVQRPTHRPVDRPSRSPRPMTGGQAWRPGESAQQRRRMPESRPPVVPPLPEERSDDVERYFKLEKFDQPGIEMQSAPLESGFADAPPAVSSRPAAAVGTAVLTDILGGRDGLRRMILAQEILGKPKCLQNA